MRKKVVSTLVAAITIMSMFAGCSGRTEEPAENPSGEISSQAEEDTQGGETYPELQDENPYRTESVTAMDENGNIVTVFTKGRR